MEKRWRNLLAVVAVVAIASVLYLFVGQLPPAEEDDSTPFDLEFYELNQLFEGHGLELGSSLAANKSFYGLEKSELVSLKGNLKNFSSSSEFKVGELSDAFVYLVDFAIKRKEFNAKEKVVESMPSENYCENIALFEELSTLGDGVVTSLANFENTHNAFVQSHESELVKHNILYETNLNVESELELQKGREISMSLLKGSCGA